MTQPLFISSGPNKVVGFNVGHRWDIQNPTERVPESSAPFNMFPVIVEGGGRYDTDPSPTVYKEDSYFKWGYYGATSNPDGSLRSRRHNNDGPIVSIREEIDIDKLKIALQNIPPHSDYNFNVEHWPLDIRFHNDETVQTSIERYKSFFRAANNFRPDINFNLYGYPPLRNYWECSDYLKGIAALTKYDKGETLNDPELRSLNHVTKTVAGKKVFDSTKLTVKNYVRWQEANSRLTYDTDGKSNRLPNTYGLSGQLNHINASVYDFYPGVDEWYFRGNIAEARRISLGKPVIVYVWPNYHDSNKTVGNTPQPIDEWRAQLKIIFEEADGIIIWGSNKSIHQDHYWVALEEAAFASNKVKAPFQQLIDFANRYAQIRNVPTESIGLTP